MIDENRCYKCRRDADMTYRIRPVCQKCWEWICEQIDAGRLDKIAKAFDIEFEARKPASESSQSAPATELIDIELPAPSVDDDL